MPLPELRMFRNACPSGLNFSNGNFEGPAFSLFPRAVAPAAQMKIPPIAERAHAAKSGDPAAP